MAGSGGGGKGDIQLSYSTMVNGYVLLIFNSQFQFPRPKSLAAYIAQ